MENEKKQEKEEVNQSIKRNQQALKKVIKKRQDDMKTS